MGNMVLRIRQMYTVDDAGEFVCMEMRCSKMWAINSCTDARHARRREKSFSSYSRNLSIDWPNFQEYISNHSQVLETFLAPLEANNTCTICDMRKVSWNLSNRLAMWDISLSLWKYDRQEEKYNWWEGRNKSKQVSLSLEIWLTEMRNAKVFLKKSSRNLSQTSIGGVRLWW